MRINECAWLSMLVGVAAAGCGGDARERVAGAVVGPTAGGSGGAPSPSGGASSGGAPGASAGGGIGSGGTSTGGDAGCPAPFSPVGAVPCPDPIGLICCDGVCRYQANDPMNCGACGQVCPPTKPFCDNGVCVVSPCAACPSGRLCCSVHYLPSEGGGPGYGPSCYDPVDGTCPIGYPWYLCAAFDTPVATPDGEVPIDSLHVGDLVWSVDHGTTRVVPIVRTNRSPVSHHHMVEVMLEGGRVVRMSEGHPTAAGGSFVGLSPGDRLGESQIIGIRSVPYDGDATYDILPDSDTGVYFAAGAPVGSTLKPSTVAQGR